jgi:hypothetical protein
LALFVGVLGQVSSLSGGVSVGFEVAAPHPLWVAEDYTRHSREDRERTLHFYDPVPVTVENLVKPAFYQNGLFLLTGGMVIVFLTGMVLHLSRRHRRHTLATKCLQAELTRAQLQAMKAQLHPHFLFNTLNTISVLVTKNPDKANRMIVLLSDLLRETVETSQADEVSLRRELELLRSYVEIQTIRFDRCLSVSYDVNADLLDARLPVLILQPIVENAIRHGIAKLPNGGRIEIRAQKLDESLVLHVQDEGPGLSLEQIHMRSSRGVGLRNTSKRLACIYGNSSSFKIQSGRPRGTLATIVIPFHESADSHDGTRMKERALDLNLRQSRVRSS